MLVMMLAATILVAATLVIHYEVLRITSDLLPKLPLPPRLKILFLVFAAFFGHTVEVWFYAAALWGIAEWTTLGHLVVSGLGRSDKFLEYLYFSTATYTTIGFGDVVPVGALRMLTGVEGLNGLMLIGWSASATYLAMEKLWPLHATRPHRERKP
jgi:hypothetical protein